MANRKRIVVGYLYNANGMAAWNIEVATALHNVGHQVLLVCSALVKLPVGLPFEVLVLQDEIPKRNFFQFVVYHIKRVFNKRNGFAFKLDQLLRERNQQPDLYLFNQSNLIDPRVSIPQYIKASTYPSNLVTYLNSVLLTINFKTSSLKQIINQFVEVIGWYFTDWYAYKRVQGVLCHTEALAKELKAKGVNAFAVPPPIMISEPNLTTHEKLIFLTVALGVEDKRKRIPWIIDHFLASGVKGELHVIGHASEAIKEHYADYAHKVHFLGSVPREKMPEIYKRSDVFLFASTSDTWGYVLTEAMSHALIVIAPDLYPYDYIVSDERFLFPMYDGEAFQEKLHQIEKTPNLTADRYFFRQRAKTEFSHEQFVKKLSHISNLMAS